MGNPTPPSAGCQTREEPRVARRPPNPEGRPDVGARTSIPTTRTLPVSFPKPLSVEDVLAKAEGEVFQLSDGSYMIRCFAHGDATPSLHVDRKPDGSALLYCFAGCAYEDVLAGLNEATPHPSPSKIKKGDPLDGFEVVSNYGYRDEDNKLLYTITRYENAEGKKTFRRS